jgi:hypothetical protein
MHVGTFMIMYLILTANFQIFFEPVRCLQYVHTFI